jgi:hypothetical protein
VHQVGEKGNYSLAIAVFQSEAVYVHHKDLLASKLEWEVGMTQHIFKSLTRSTLRNPVLGFVGITFVLG